MKLNIETIAWNENTRLILFHQLQCSNMCPKSSISNNQIIVIILFKSFDFWYMFVFFLELLKNKKKSFRVCDCSNIIEVKLWDPWVTWKIVEFFFFKFENVFEPGIKPGTFSVLDWRDNQLHHPNNLHIFFDIQIQCY